MAAIIVTSDDVPEKVTQGIYVPSFTPDDGEEESCLDSIYIGHAPDMTYYIAGMDFDVAGMIVYAVYDDEDEKIVTNYTVLDGKSLSSGKTSVTVSYTERGITKTATQQITVVGDVWDGTTSDVQPEANGIYYISNAEELAWFAKEVNGGNNFSNKTVKLTNKINLDGMAWTPIGLNADGPNKFMGTFDGQGNTIFNLYVKQGAKYHAAGLFGALNGTVKNLNIVGASVESISSGNAAGNTTNGTAVIAGSIYTSGTITDCTVTDAKVKGNRYVGGIAGYVYGTITDCTVSDSEFIATPDLFNGNYDNGDKVGGIAGYWPKDSTNLLSENKVSNVSLTAYRDVGCIVGASNWVNNILSNTVSGENSITIDRSIYYGPKDYNAGKVCGRNTGSSSDSLGENTVDGVVNIILPSVKSVENLKLSLKNGGNAVLESDLELTETLDVPAGVEVTLNMNGKTLSMPDGQNVNTVPCMIKVKMADVAGGPVGKLTITGNGTFDVGNNGAAAIFPGGDVVIENGTFVRDLTGIDFEDAYPLISGYNGNKYPGKLGEKLTINGGYFDGGYYNTEANKLFIGFVETHEAGQGQHTDKNDIRLAVKDNVSALINVSNDYIYNVNGGTFVGANPAWGDEGCMLPSNYNGNYLRPWSYYQGGFIPGQAFNENDIVLPEGYSITEGKTDSGIPTYTVNYTK